MVEANSAGEAGTDVARYRPARRQFVWLKGILAVLAVIVLVFIGVVAMQPAEFAVTRSAAMNAPPSAPFAQVNDFRNWEAWSPWEKRDPSMKRTYGGPPAGTGATYAWVGNSDVGEGHMTITESRPSDFVRIRLEFLKPFAASNTTEFTFQPQGDQSLVTWTMSGRSNFVGKAFCLFMSMDKMVGGDFEKGLAQMKAAAEAAPAQ